MSRRKPLPPGIALLLLLLLVLVSLSCGPAGLGVNFTGWAGPVVVDDAVYLASKKGADRASVRALSAFDGNEQGRFTPTVKLEAIYGTPVVEGNTLYTTSVYQSNGTEFGRVYAVDVNSLVTAWEFPPLGRDDMGPVFGGVAFSPDTSTIYVGSADGKLYALDASDGTPKRGAGGVVFDAKSPIWGAPVVDKGIVYFGTMGGTLFGVNEGGGKAFEFRVGGAIAATPLVKDGVVYVGSFDKKFYAIVPGINKPKWTFSGDNWFWGEAILAQVPGTGDIIFVGSLDGKVYALNAGSGNPVWLQPFQTGQGIRAGPVLANRTSFSGPFANVTDQVLVVGSRDGMVYGLDPISGKLAWKEPFDAGGRVLAPPTAVNNIIYVSNTDHDLFALDAETGTLMTAFP
ncbi:MAG: PQQ-binding-like beta-propeller repeat protein [Dehalococcoidia bacterium]